MEADELSVILAQAKGDEAINRLEGVLSALPQQEMPVKHHFTPGLYSREIFMPAGTVLTSKIHKTRHPFIISKGKVSVHTPNEGVVTLEAPFFGVTKPGTRRALYIHEDTIWTTFHVTQETDLAVIEKLLIEPHDFHAPNLTCAQPAVQLQEVQS